MTTHVKTSAAGAKMCFQFGDFYIPRLPRLPILCLCVFSSLPLKPKMEKNSTLGRLVAHASQDSRTITFSGEIHSQHKHIPPSKLNGLFLTATAAREWTLFKQILFVPESFT